MKIIEIPRVSSVTLWPLGTKQTHLDYPKQHVWEAVAWSASQWETDSPLYWNLAEEDEWGL